MLTFSRALCCLAASLAFIAPAYAENRRFSIEADPIPLVEARVNGQDVRLEVDLSLPDIIVFNPDVAERLEVRTLPFTRANVVLDEARISGRVARPRLEFQDGERARAFAGVFALPVTERADGVVGPGVLPYNEISIQFAPARPGERDVVIDLDNPDVWSANLSLAPDLTVRADLTLSRPSTLFNRSTTAGLESRRLLSPQGDLETREFLLGLSTRMQPVVLDPSLTFFGIPIRRAIAFTPAEIIGADEEAAVFVTAESDAVPPPRLTLGAEDLRAACSSVTVNRGARTMTLRCAPPQ